MEQQTARGISIQPYFRARCRACQAQESYVTGIFRESCFAARRDHERVCDLLIVKLRGKAQAVEKEEDENVVDMMQWMNFVTFDIMSDLGLGDDTFNVLPRQYIHREPGA